jgi:citronellol/citronellal dehydrogenase
MNVYPEEARRRLPMSNLLRRFGDPTEVADTVCYLAGPTGAFLTGAEIVLDGGMQVYGDLWTIPKPDWFSEPKDGL